MRNEVPQTLTDGLVDSFATELLAALDERRQIAPVSTRQSQLDLSGAYQVAATICRMRQSRGEMPVGRKLGFTNSNIWDEYAVYAPIWGYIYDTTVRVVGANPATIPISAFLQPRIEPEIVLSFKVPPQPGMSERDILDCVEWAAHGFEIVQSLFPDWRFAAADTVAAFGLHGALLLGPQHEIQANQKDRWFDVLSTFEVALLKDGHVIDVGHASNVLGGPLSAVRNVVEVLARDGHNPPLGVGEIVTTGTITRAFPVVAGETWCTSVRGAPFEGLHLTLG